MKKKLYLTLAILTMPAVCQGAIQTIAAATAVDPTAAGIIPIVSSGGAVTVTANPQVANSEVTGQIIVLKGTSNTDYNIYSNGNGFLIINGHYVPYWNDITP